MREPRGEGPTVISLVSGKGGVGKSLLAVNLALTWAEEGFRVALVDADLGQSSCALLLGQSAGMVELVAGHASLESLETDLHLLASRADFVIIDAPAGLGPGVCWALDRADASLLTIVDEPTAVADAYALCKMVWQSDPAYPLAAVVNMADGERDAADVVRRFSSLTGHFLDRKILYAGWVPFSDAIRRSVQRQTPAVQLAPSVQDAFCALAASIRCGVFDPIAPAGLN